MSKGKQKPLSQTQCPAFTDEGRESNLISLAMDAAEQQLRDGTASSQIITYCLKLGSERAHLEAEKIRYENELLAVKRKAIEAEQANIAKYEEAIAAITGYKGESQVEYDEDENFYTLVDSSDF